jgi:hypothetical protein
MVLGPGADWNVVFGRHVHYRQRTSAAEQVAYLLLGAACRHQPQPTRAIRRLTVTCADTPNPHVHIDCSENADEREPLVGLDQPG